MMIEDFKKDINSALKEIQEKTGKKVEVLKEKHKILYRITGKQNQSDKELNKTKQDLKMEIKTGEGTEQKNPGSNNGTTNNKEIINGRQPWR